MNVLWPNGSTNRPKVSSGFGPRNLDNPLASTYHRGTDFYGFPTVHAIADGEVVYVGWYDGVGWSPVAGFMVWIQHEGLFSRYLHTDSTTIRVAVGDRVKAGDPLIDMGWSGLANPWDEHVHLEITPGRWHTGNTGQVDPVAWLAARVGTSGAGGITATKGNPLETYILRNDGTVFHIIAGIQCYQFTSVKDYNDWKGVVDTQRKQGATNLISPPRLGKLKKMPAWRVDALRKRYGV